MSRGCHIWNFCVHSSSTRPPRLVHLFFDIKTRSSITRKRCSCYGTFEICIHLLLMLLPIPALSWKLRLTDDDMMQFHHSERLRAGAFPLLTRHLVMSSMNVLLPSQRWWHTIVAITIFLCLKAFVSKSVHTSRNGTVVNDGSMVRKIRFTLEGKISYCRYLSDSTTYSRSST